VRDEWADRKQLAIQYVTLRPLQLPDISKVIGWLKIPAVRESFVPRFPENESELRKYFTHPTREYFGVYYNDQLVGIVGGESIDLTAGKLEMKKLVGESGLQGKGIGKRATFGFLYYAFMIRNLNKVYIHSRDINMRNINLNTRFGFELEGVFLDDITVGDKHQDVLRMALFKSLWLQIFSHGACHLPNDSLTIEPFRDNSSSRPELNLIHEKVCEVELRMLNFRVALLSLMPTLFLDRQVKLQ
jgi:RimJ/RimL family protein N-acetyltransferase